MDVKLGTFIGGQPFSFMDDEERRRLGVNESKFYAGEPSDHY